MAADAASRHRRHRTNAKAAKLFALFAVCAFSALSARAARAQNWDFDARTIGLGGVSGSGTIASEMIEQGAGYRSTFRYCMAVLHMSEDAVYNRIEAAHAIRRFPQIVGMLREGTLSLTTARMLATWRRERQPSVR